MLSRYPTTELHPQPSNTFFSPLVAQGTLRLSYNQILYHHEHQFLF